MKARVAGELAGAADRLAGRLPGSASWARQVLGFHM